MITFNGETKTLQQWSQHVGFTDNGSALAYRLKHWDTARALTTPAPVHTMVTIDGTRMSIPQAATKLGMSGDSLRRLIAKKGVDAAIVYKIKKHERHGLAQSPEYRIWYAMKYRCYNPKHPEYALYGGRGITVCNQWRNSFLTFIQDVGRRPQGKNITIERIDNNGNYEPGNVEWRSRKANQRNTRANIMIEHNGEVRCLAEWAEVLGQNYAMLYSRWRKYGTIEKVKVYGNV